MSASFNERRTLEVSLRQALGSQQLFVEFQPVVRIEGTIPVGLEALVRWRHPERGLLSPGVFVPIAERCGMEDLLGEHVLRAVCRQLRQWLNDMVPVVPVAINVSPRQFERGRLIDTIERITREFDIDPALLTIELTESALMQHALQNLTTLGKLRDLGVRVAIDDFGTGYSSLAYLKNLPIDSIKIDRSFVNDITRDRRDSNIIQAIVGIGASLGIRVVAEGVETVEQSKILRQLGCTIAQGYLYHRPMSAAACTDLLMSMPAHIDPSDTIPTRRLDMSESELGG
jgi:EAL domain-containing protein (putative c-di-GMP-specific phosphodiesterase class I)